MSVQAIEISTPKRTTCPHGNPAGACPLCKGGGGGSSSISSDRNTRRRAGEMTWNECYAMGLILKQRALEKDRLEQQNARLEANLFSQNINFVNLATRLNNALTMIFATVNANFVSLNRNVLQPMLNSLQTLANTAKNILQNVASQAKHILQDIKQKIIDISDKLAAIYGEMKNALAKNVSDAFKRFAKKAFGFLSIIDASLETDDDEKRKEEEKRIAQNQKIHEKILSPQDERVAQIEEE